MALQRQNAPAEVYHGKEICKQKAMELLDEVRLPRGLLPLDDLEECGIVRETGYVWMKQKKKVEYAFNKIGKICQYAAEVTATVEKHKMKNLTGVKAKELFLWIPIVEISTGSSSSNVYFKSNTGIGRSFPISVFEIEDKKDDNSPE
eukprot:TRINITY_DN36613_c0_g1_i1.p1 TRINITY_DN36613_c0_g1~~TRINITY_DN36613_c0_g1_i1.p1  ORF type:complete len:147 (-),score=17.82 TRINITY_DN36613_c0_g1_i1:51-491(-)